MNMYFVRAVLVVGLLAGVGSAETLNDWRFNEVAGTTLTNTLNAGSEGALWNQDITNSSTDGGGLFVLASTNNNFRDADIADITSGKVYLRFDVASWDLSAGTTINSALSVGIRDATGVSGTNDLVLLRVLHKAEDDVELQTRVGTVNTGIANFGELFTNGVSAILEVDLDVDLFQVYYRSGRQPFVQVMTNRSVSAAGLNAQLIRFSTAGSIGESTDTMRVDRIRQATTLEELIADYRVTNLVVTSTRGEQFSGQTGLVYRLQYDTVTPPEEWLDAGVEQSGTGGTMTLVDPAGYSTLRVYRVISN